MTKQELRDSIAIGAMQGMLANHGQQTSQEKMKILLQESYLLADFALIERENHEHKGDVCELCGKKKE